MTLVASFFWIQLIEDTTRHQIHLKDMSYDTDHHLVMRSPQNPADILLGMKLGAKAIKVKAASSGAEALIKGSLFLGAQNLKMGAIGGLIQGAKNLKTVFKGAKFAKKGLALAKRPIKKPLQILNKFGKKLMKCCWWLTG